jgi:hypothetical protein
MARNPLTEGLHLLIPELAVRLCTWCAQRAPQMNQIGSLEWTTAPRSSRRTTGAMVLNP